MSIGIRWTIGDVRERGFEALRLSIWGAHHIFGGAAEYCVCVNNVGVEAAKARTGDIPDAVRWMDATQEIPGLLRQYMDDSMAEGVAWKLSPLRVFPERHELSLDNDCILWELPGAIAHWLAQASACLMAEDVTRCFGRFEAMCPAEPRNAGLRGLPPGFDLEAAITTVLGRVGSGRQPLSMTSETDEQGLQTAALSLHQPAYAVSLADVTICSPFHPHLPHLGRCGAHFVGLNARHIPWNYYDRPADDCMAEHWARHRPELLKRIPQAQLQEVR